MRASTNIEKLATTLKKITNEEQAQTKGGILWYCEEKRATFGESTYTYVAWTAVDDGSPFTTFRF